MDTIGEALWEVGPGQYLLIPDTLYIETTRVHQREYRLALSPYSGFPGSCSIVPFSSLEHQLDRTEVQLDSRSTGWLRNLSPVSFSRPCYYQTR